MKTKLPARSRRRIQRYLDKALQAILHGSGDKLTMVIVFGSYARGDWVEDAYEKDGRIEAYQSDLDIMLVFKKGGDAGAYKADAVIKKIDYLLEKYVLHPLRHKDMIPGHPNINFKYESINSLNKQLELGRYFFTDVKKEGIVIYDTGEFQLAEPKELPWEKIKDIAQFDYDYWFNNGKEFLIDCKNCIERNNYNKAAFELHQATESLYDAIWLVCGGYKPKTHDLKELKGTTHQYCTSELMKIFSCTNEEEKKSFELLCDAYVKARYDRNYKITLEQLNYLIAEVEKLQAITERICLERLSK